MSTVSRIPVTITSGQTVSSSVDTKEQAIVGIEIPATFTGVALTFQTASNPAGPFQPLTKTDGTNYSIVVAQGKNVIIPPTDLAGWRIVKLVSGAAEGATRVINLMVRAV